MFASYVGMPRGPLKPSGYRSPVIFFPKHFGPSRLVDAAESPSRAALSSRLWVMVLRASSEFAADLSERLRVMVWRASFGASALWFRGAGGAAAAPATAPSARRPRPRLPLPFPLLVECSTPSLRGGGQLARLAATSSRPPLELR